MSLQPCFVLGVDGGTESLRAGVFSLKGGFRFVAIMVISHDAINALSIIERVSVIRFSGVQCVGVQIYLVCMQHA